MDSINDIKSFQDFTNDSQVAQKPVLDVLYLQRLFQEGIVLKVDNAEHQVVTSAPIGVKSSVLRGVLGIEDLAVP